MLSVVNKFYPNLNELIETLYQYKLDYLLGDSNSIFRFININKKFANHIGLIKDLGI